jgi:hypothetical protein
MNELRLRRVCPKCQLPKDGSAFYKDAVHHVWCKSCERVSMTAYYHKHKHEPRFKQYNQRSKTKPTNVFRMYKHNAEAREISWQLSMEQFLSFWQKPCHYCGQEIQTAGLDRQNNSLGYIMANVVPCCTGCNYMKRTASHNDFIRQCSLIATKWAGKI